MSPNLQLGSCKPVEIAGLGVAFSAGRLEITEEGDWRSNVDTSVLGGFSRKRFVMAIYHL